MAFQILNIKLKMYHFKKDTNVQKLLGHDIDISEYFTIKLDNYTNEEVLFSSVGFEPIYLSYSIYLAYFCKRKRLLRSLQVFTRKENIKASIIRWKKDPPRETIER